MAVRCGVLRRQPVTLQRSAGKLDYARPHPRPPSFADTDPREPKKERIEPKDRPTASGFTPTGLYFPILP